MKPTPYPRQALKLAWLALISGFFFFCTAPNEPPPRSSPKRPDPEIQKNCQKSYKKQCSSKCEDICDDLFNKQKYRDSCQRLPDKLVLDFERLIEDIEKGDFEDLIEEIDRGNTENISDFVFVLECLMDIDETPVASAVKEMSERETIDFLYVAANDREISYVLKTEDKEYRVLKELLSNMGNAKQAPVFTEKIDGTPLITLFAGSYKQAFDWIDDYIEDICSRGECPLSFYCDIFLDLSNSQQSDFISDGDWFARKYEEDIEDERVPGSSDDYFAFDSGGRNDFEDYCKHITSQTSSSSTSPNTNPGSTPTPAPTATPAPTSAPTPTPIPYATDRCYQFKTEAACTGPPRTRNNGCRWLPFSSHCRNNKPCVHPGCYLENGECKGTPTPICRL